MTTDNRTRISIPPGNLSDMAQWKRQVSNWIQEANQGHLSNTGTVTLTANAASTTVTDTRAGVNSFIGFMPTTANAATGLTVMYVSARAKQQFTITHANNAQTDRTYTYAILG